MVGGTRSAVHLSWQPPYSADRLEVPTLSGRSSTADDRHQARTPGSFSWRHESRSSTLPHRTPEPGLLLQGLTSSHSELVGRCWPGPAEARVPLARVSYETLTS